MNPPTKLFRKVKLEELKRLLPEQVLAGNENHNHNQKEKKKSKRMVETRKPKSRA